MVAAIQAVAKTLPGSQAMIIQTPKGPKMRSALAPLKSFASLAKSEYRVTMFVWSLVIAYLIATDLKPNFLQLGE